MLFAALKRKGFNLEDTPLTHKYRLEKIFAIAAIAAVWTLQAGQNSVAQSPKKPRILRPLRLPARPEPCPRKLDPAPT